MKVRFLLVLFENCSKFNVDYEKNLRILKKIIYIFRYYVVLKPDLKLNLVWKAIVLKEKMFLRVLLTVVKMLSKELFVYFLPIEENSFVMLHLGEVFLFPRWLSSSNY